MTDFFISDLHLFHKNVLKYDKAPFATIEEMHSALKERWNAVVKPNDSVYVIGDIAFHKDADEVAEFLDSLNGEKHLIFGNHDKKIDKAILDCFKSKQYYLELRRGDDSIILFHYPIWEWNKAHRGAYHLHGHCHGHSGFTRDGRIMDVGAVCLNYTPISLEDVIAKLKSKPLLTHH
jgi:calcineurin-like phosphoesterase family protein